MVKAKDVLTGGFAYRPILDWLKGPEFEVPKVDPSEIRKEIRAKFNATPGARESMAGLKSLLEQSRNLPIDASLQDQIIAGIRQQASAGAPQAATPAGVSGAAAMGQQAVGAAISGAEAMRTSRFLQRFQAQERILGQMGQMATAFGAGVYDRYAEARANVKIAQHQAKMDRINMVLRAAGTAASAVGGMMGSSAGGGAAAAGATPAAAQGIQGASTAPVIQSGIRGGTIAPLATPVTTPGTLNQISPFDLGLSGFRSGAY